MMNRYQEILNNSYYNDYEKVMDVNDEIRRKFDEGQLLTREEMVLMCVAELNDNVNQDGIEGYIVNMYSRDFFPEYLPITLQALKEINAMQTYERFKDVCKRYSNMTDHDLRNMIDTDLEFIEAFDDWFYEYHENLVDFEYQYILKHLV